jgi:tRNA pseudouridine32 synthase/23S rRNA pseudouridine746 synthase
MLDFLVQRFAAIPEKEWLRRIVALEVVDEFGVHVTPERRYQPHIRLYYYRSLAHEPRIPFDEVVLFQDEHLVVADKPHFLPVTAGGCYVQEVLQVRLKRRLHIDTLQPIHRIDRETAGVVVFCVQPCERDAYHALFRQHAVQKTYQAIAPWRSELLLPQTRHSRIVQGEPFFRQCETPGAPNAQTEIEVLEVQGERAHYRLLPHTGQKHQLRVHMAALGLALENDPFYPEVRRGQDESDDWNRPLQLLAKSIAFMDPITGQPRHFESPQQLRL